MPFFAECPFCHRKLRGVPDHAVGASVSCPRCGSFFTLAPMANPPAEPAPSHPAKEAPAPVIHAPPAVSRAVQAARLRPRPEPPLPNLEEDEAQEPAFLPSHRGLGEPMAAAPSWRRLLDPVGAASLLAGSIGLLVASFRWLNLLTLPLAGLGLVLGLVGVARLANAGKKGIALPAAGAAASFVVLVLAAFWPALLGMAPRSVGVGTEHPRQTFVPRAGMSGGLPAGPQEAEWVDAARGALHYGDLRVRVTSVTVVPAEPKRPADKRAKREQYLQIGLRLANIGAAKTFEYHSWGELDQPELTLTDNLGRTYRRQALPPGTEPPGRVRRAELRPGKSVDDLLVFAAPPDAVEYLRLELPAEAFGATGRLRLQVPRSLIRYR